MPYKNSEGRVTLPVVLEVGGDSLLDRQGTSMMRFEVYAYALDAQGVIADVAPGDYTLEVTLQDPRTAAVSRAGQSVRVY